MGAVRILQLFLSLLLILLVCVDAQQSIEQDQPDGGYVNGTLDAQMRFGTEDLKRWKDKLKDMLKNLGESDIVKYINTRVRSFKATIYRKFQGLSSKELNQRFLGAKMKPETRMMLQRLQTTNSTAPKRRRKRDYSDLGNVCDWRPPKRCPDGLPPPCLEDMPWSPKYRGNQKPAPSPYGRPGGGYGGGGGWGAPKKKNPGIGSFDSRKEWPMCRDVIEAVQDQGQCGACWAVASASAFTDARCINSKGQNKERLSAWDLASCCTKCHESAGHGCSGGDSFTAGDFFFQEGLVTGEGYQQGGCVPFEPPPGNKGGAEFGRPSTPTPCRRQCQSSYGKDYASDKKRGGFPSRYQAGREEAVMECLKKNGVAIMTYSIYRDFFNYKSGVYEHTAGSFVGDHVVKIIGWGEENGIPYLLCVNSWGAEWGEKGLFKFALTDKNKKLVGVYDCPNARGFG